MFRHAEFYAAVVGMVVFVVCFIDFVTSVRGGHKHDE
jgi:hypothetical protein